MGMLTSWLGHCSLYSTPDYHSVPQEHVIKTIANPKERRKVGDSLCTSIFFMSRMQISHNWQIHQITMCLHSWMILEYFRYLKFFQASIETTQRWLAPFSLFSLKPASVSGSPVSSTSIYFILEVTLECKGQQTSLLIFVVQKNTFSVS